MRELQEKCAVFGAIGGPDCVALTYIGLKALQNRGQDHSGIAALQENGNVVVLKANGLVASFCNKPRFKNLKGTISTGHNRYATAGASTLINAQPHLSRNGKMALCANGDIVPSETSYWRHEMECKGFPLVSSNDGELHMRIVEWRISEGGTPFEALQFLVRNVTGAFSGTLIANNQLIAFRDPRGTRPLVFGTRSDGYSFVASEDCALKKLMVDSWDEIKPGEVRLIDQDGAISSSVEPYQKQAKCVFCGIYIANPQSTIFGIPVSLNRKRQGAKLSRFIPEDADIIIPVPDTSNHAALGLSQATGIPFEFGIIRPHHQGRSFIEPTQAKRLRVVDEKLIPDEEIIRGKRIVLVDDSIVRATTLKLLIEKLRRADPIKIHVLIVAPVMTHPCFYGVATPTSEELIGANMSVEEIRVHIGADTLAYLTVEDHREIIASFGENPDGYCFACSNGDYPTKL
ncbi:MAG: amidophosphoribosyltransferase [Patescibacteria group bacterium]